ncbi:tRNA wybutosine-synthesizing protein 3 homolog isoform X1 [Dromaius novaehollandiae]
MPVPAEPRCSHPAGPSGGAAGAGSPGGAQAAARWLLAAPRALSAGVAGAAPVPGDVGPGDASRAAAAPQGRGEEPRALPTAAAAVPGRGAVMRVIQRLQKQTRPVWNTPVRGSVEGRWRQQRSVDTNRYEVQKKNCSWLMVSHEMCSKDDVMTALEKATGDTVLKFEPFVLHVLCQELQDAQLLHSVAINSGFRNSGITVGRRGKIMMAVRSTHCLEVPLSRMGKLMVSEEYIEFLIHTANRKMEENMRRIDRFYNCLQLALKTALSANNSPSEEREKNHCVYVHRRKRKTIQKHGVCTSPKDHDEELEHEDDPKSNVDIFGEIMI